MLCSPALDILSSLLPKSVLLTWFHQPSAASRKGRRSDASGQLFSAGEAREEERRRGGAAAHLRGRARRRDQAARSAAEELGRVRSSARGQAPGVSHPPAGGAGGVQLFDKRPGGGVESGEQKSERARLKKLEPGTKRSRVVLLPPIPPSIRVFSNESVLCIRWPKYWSFSFSIIPSKEIPGLISFRMDWLDQG